MKLLLHIWVSIQLYKMGLFFTKNTHNGESWGFYRLNHKDRYGLLDIDFSWEQRNRFVHVHGKESIYYWTSP